MLRCILGMVVVSLRLDMCSRKNRLCGQAMPQARFQRATQSHTSSTTTSPRLASEILLMSHAMPCRSRTVRKTDNEMLRCVTPPLLDTNVDRIRTRNRPVHIYSMFVD